MDSKTYWAARMMWHEMNKAEITAAEIAKIYQKAGLYVNREIKGIFEKYQTKHNLTRNEAVRLIKELRNKNDIEELKNKLAANPENKKLIAELESPAYAARIDRFVRLSNNIDYLMKSVYKQEEAANTALFRELAESSYYRGVFETQSRSGYAFKFSHINKKQIDQALKIKWSGIHFSDRIWNNTSAVAEKVRTDMLVNLLTGRTEWDTAKDIMKDFNQGANAARRLVRTESCYVSAEMTAQGYEECNVERYRFVSVLDMKTSKV